MRRQARVILFCSAMLLIVSNAGADGIPAAPLSYSGVMLGANGQPTTTAQLVTLSLWRSETSTSVTDRLCNPPAETVTPDNQGRFSATIQPVCVDVVRTTPEVWLEVRVGVEVLRPRSKLRAVPFAVEADRTSRHTVSTDAGSISVGGIWCGYSDPKTGTITAPGGLTGYRAAKVLCETVSGCTRTAHMCTTDEMIRTTSLGVMVTGWYARGSMALHNSSTFASDCGGYTLQTGAVGSVWAGNVPGNADCLTTMHPILCCD